MLFYFVRHGQTDANHQRVMAGSGLDYDLNEEGHRQAQALARDLRRHIPHSVHRVIASDLKRAQQTGRYLATELGLQLETHSNLREWKLGEWEGKPYQTYMPLLLGNGEPSEGESRRDFYARVENAWTSLHNAAEPYVLISHGGVWLALQDILKIRRFPVRNCHLIKLSLVDEIWQAEILNP